MSDELCPPPPTDDDDLTLPRASINKMIKELVPIRVSNESRELIMNCCTEFIHLISSEANEICKQHNKKTINAEHILLALDSLGFPDYKHDANSVLNDCKEVAANRRRQSTRLENLGIPEEELLRLQQELFAQAREEQAQAEHAQLQALSKNLSAGHNTTMPPPQAAAHPTAFRLPLTQQSSINDQGEDEDDDDDD